MDITNNTSLKTYDIKNQQKIEKILTLVERISETAQTSGESIIKFSFKDYGLIRELTTLATSYKKDMETKILEDKEFTSFNINDLGKTLAKTYKNTFDLKNFIADYETNIQPLAPEIKLKYTTITYKQNRPATEEDKTTKKTVNIIDEIKVNTPSTKIGVITDLVRNNTKPSTSPILSYTKIK